MKGGMTTQKRKNLALTAATRFVSLYREGFDACVMAKDIFIPEEAV